MKAHFAMMAAYSRWANVRLYAAAKALPEAEYRRNRGAFFGSLHGTLNHLLVADRVWMRRFTGSGPLQTRLDEILFDELPALEAARIRRGRADHGLRRGAERGGYAGTLTYRTIVNPADITQPLSPALAHFFNHQTHHRGQAHCLVTQAAGNAAMPSLDLIIFQRETGIGLS